MQARRNAKGGRRYTWAMAGALVLSMPLLAATAAQPVPAADGGYQLPSKALQAVVDAPRAPLLQLSPQRDLAAMLQLPALPDNLQYLFVGRHIVLLDGDTQLIVDYVDNVLPPR